MEYVPYLLFAATIAEIVDTVGRQEIRQANIEQTLSQFLNEMYSLEEKTGMMPIAVTTRTVNVDSNSLEFS
jgi:ATP-dependent Zn protease